jgi:hypothetical protein
MQRFLASLAIGDNPARKNTLKYADSEKERDNQWDNPASFSARILDFAMVISSSVGSRCSFSALFLIFTASRTPSAS